MNLIEQVIDLDGRATKGPWQARREVVAIAMADHDGVTRHPTACRVDPVLRTPTLDREDINAKNFECYSRTDGGPDSSLIALYRTAAPKLARALKKAFDLLQSYRDRRTEFERITGESDHTVDRCEHAMNICRQQRVNKILAEIEKELAP